MKTIARLLTAGLLAATSLVATQVTGAAAAPYKHVLLISVDGLHALDVANYVAAHPDSTLASLVKTGVFYPSALTTNPSDSYPGMLAQVTGGTPKSTGVFYDDSYVRNFFAPGSDCKGTTRSHIARKKSTTNPEAWDRKGVARLFFLMRGPSPIIFFPDGNGLLHSLDSKLAVQVVVNYW